MTVWQKAMVVVKALFGGFDDVVDYVLGLLNAFLAQSDVEGRVKTGYRLASNVLSYLVKYGDLCPARWETEFKATVSAVRTLVDVFADGKVTAEELASAKDAFVAAYKAWMD